MKQNLKVIVKSTMILFVLMCFCTACGGKYDDFVKVNEDFIETIEGFKKNLEKVDNAKDVVSALNAAAKKFEKIGLRIDKLIEKYPDPKSKKDLYEIQLQFEKEIEKVNNGLGETTDLVFKKYKGNPEVKAAKGRLGGALFGAVLRLNSLLKVKE